MILNLKRYISLLLVLMLLIGIVPQAYAAELPTDSTIPEETVSETVETTAPTAPIDSTDPTEPTDPPDETTEPTAETEPAASPSPTVERNSVLCILHSALIVTVPL